MSLPLKAKVAVRWFCALFLLGCEPPRVTVPGKPDEGSPLDGTQSHQGAPDGGASDSGAPDSDTSDGGSRASATTTDADLAEHWARYGDPRTFPASYVERVEAVMRAEDEVTAGNFAAARARIDAIFAKYPRSDDIWWEGNNHANTWIGSPVGYYAMRMLDEIATVGLRNPKPAAKALMMTVVLPECADVERAGGQVERVTLAPEATRNDHFVLRQGVHLLQLYVWAITDGEYRLDLRFHHQKACAKVPLTDYQYWQPLEAVPDELKETTHFWWLVTPLGRLYDEKTGFQGGMGGFRGGPAFLCEDMWLIKRMRANSGGVGGPLSAAERRVYHPMWFHHEFFHFLGTKWPEFALETTPHQWFDRSTWPADFVGKWEPDYYAETLHKRLYGAKPSISDVFSRAVR